MVEKFAGLVVLSGLCKYWFVHQFQSIASSFQRRQTFDSLHLRPKSQSGFDTTHGLFDVLQSFSTHYQFDLKMNKKRKVKKVGQLLLGIASIWGFMFLLVPLLTQNTASQQMIEFIEKRAIEADALFYTESEAALKSERLMRKKME